MISQHFRFAQTGERISEQMRVPPVVVPPFQFDPWTERLGLLIKVGGFQIL